MARPKGQTVTRTCACGCNTSFTVPIWDPKKFFNETHYRNWLRGKNHPQYKTGAYVKDPKTGKPINSTAFRKGKRAHRRKETGVYKRYPAIRDDVLIRVGGRRTRKPLKVRETILKKKIKKRCPICNGTFYVHPSKATQQTCGNKCKIKLRKRDSKGKLV